MKRSEAKLIIRTVAILLVCPLFQACPHDDPYTTIAYIYKFNEGVDCANNQSVNQVFPDESYFHATITGYRPVPLHDGYYVGGNLDLLTGVSYILNHTAYLSITLDEIENGDAPVDWKYNYEKYIVSDNPFKEFYVWYWSSPEKESLDFPSYGCSQFPGRFCIDTSALNMIIDAGKLGDYFFRVK